MTTSPAITGKGVTTSRNEGVHPPKAIECGEGVSLTHTEHEFLEVLTCGEKNNIRRVNSLAMKAGLEPEDIEFIRRWKEYNGIFWLMRDSLMENPMPGVRCGTELERIYTRPVVRKFIGLAAERGWCRGVVALKDEIAEYHTQRLRNHLVDDRAAADSAKELAKLEGYYPDERGGSGGVTIQIALANPYDGVPEVKIGG